MGQDMENDKMKVWRFNVAGVLLIVAMLLLLSLASITNSGLAAGETIEQWIWFDKMAVVAAGIALLIPFVLRQKKYLYDSAYCLAVALMIWGGAEAVWGICQLYGFAVSGHSQYALTGSFFNPGPYAGYLAMVLPVCLCRTMELWYPWRYMPEKILRIEKCIAIGAGICILCVLPATMSRSAWLAAGISCVCVVAMENGWGRIWLGMWKWKRKRAVMTVIGSVATLMLVFFLMFMIKQDSAKGRLFMWKIACRAVAEKPWSGHGEGSFAAAFGVAQEKYFAGEEYSQWEEHVAGSPKYAFNEYLKVTIEYGIPVTILVLLVIGFCLYSGIRQERYGVCAAIISLLVFSFSSYPLQFPVFLVTLVGLLLVCVMNNRWTTLVMMAVVIAAYGIYRLPDDRKMLDACREEVNVRMLYRAGAYEAALEGYERLYPLLKEKDSFMFEYGHCLHKLERYEDSNRIMEEAMKVSNDPMILNIIGKNYQQMGNYRAAENRFIRAISRLPGRIYPYYLLAKLYAEPDFCQPDKFEEMKRIVWTKTPKVMSTAIREMREELEKIDIRIQK